MDTLEQAEKSPPEGAFQNVEVQSSLKKHLLKFLAVTFIFKCHLKVIQYQKRVGDFYGYQNKCDSIGKHYFREQCVSIHITAHICGITLFFQTIHQLYHFSIYFYDIFLLIYWWYCVGKYNLLYNDRYTSSSKQNKVAKKHGLLLFYIAK